MVRPPEAVRPVTRGRDPVALLVLGVGVLGLVVGQQRNEVSCRDARVLDGAPPPALDEIPCFTHPEPKPPFKPSPPYLLCPLPPGALDF